MQQEKNEGVYKWWLLGFLWVAFFLHQGTRQIYNAILPQIKEGLQVSDIQMGVVGTLFTMTYGICAPLSGVASDFLKRKWMVVVGLLIFCGGIFLSGFASAIGLLLITYGLLNGAGQAFYYPAACSLLAQLHEKTRATALSIHQTALYAGIVTCSCVSGYLGGLEAEGWRKPFLIFGAIGIIWALMLIFFMRDTKPVEKKATTGQVEKASFKEAFLVMIRKPSALMLAGAFGMMIYVDCGFKTWMPAFLQTPTANGGFGLAPHTAALHAVLWHYIGAFIGVMIGSRVSDKLAASGRKTIRVETNLIGLLGGVPFIWIMAHTPSQLVCFLCLGLFGVFRGIYDSNLFASLFDVVAPRYRASASGLMLCFAFLFGSSSPTVLGWMSDKFGLTQGLGSLAFFYLAGGIILLAARIFTFKKDFESQI